MTFVRAFSRLGALSALTTTLMACSGPNDEIEARFDDGGEVPARHNAVVVDTCPMDSFQRAQLASSEARSVLSEVILLCLSAHEDGSIGPTQPDAITSLDEQARELRALGYQVSFGLSVGEGPLVQASAARTTSLLNQPAWRASVINGIGRWAKDVDGIELALPQVGNDARQRVSAMVEELAAVIRPERKLGIFVPPSTTESPSDVQGGDAYALSVIALHVDRIRVMTLDYSCCNPEPGPGTEPRWIADAASFARARTGSTPMDVTYPLFGNDFGPLGTRSVTYMEAAALASYYGASIQRSPTAVPFFNYVDATGKQHAVWYEDVFSTSVALRALDDSVLSSDIGVVFYGLGAEDPSLWRSLARGQR